MTVNELIKHLTSLPGEADVALEDSSGGVYALAAVYHSLEWSTVTLEAEANGVSGDHW